MTPHYAPVFSGLLIVTLSFKINGFDLILDGVGYVLIAIGCHRMVACSSRFASASALAIVSAVLWPFGFVAGGGFAQPYTIACSIAHYALVWQLLGGVSEHALSQQRLDLDEKARYRRALYVLGGGASVFLILLGDSSPELGVLAAVLVVAMLVVMVMILHLIHRAKKELSCQ